MVRLLTIILLLTLTGLSNTFAYNRFMSETYTCDELNQTGEDYLGVTTFPVEKATEKIKKIRFFYKDTRLDTTAFIGPIESVTVNTKTIKPWKRQTGSISLAVTYIGVAAAVAVDCVFAMCATTGSITGIGGGSGAATASSGGIVATVLTELTSAHAIITSIEAAELIKVLALTGTVVDQSWQAARKMNNYMNDLTGEQLTLHTRVNKWYLAGVSSLDSSFRAINPAFHYDTYKLEKLIKSTTESDEQCLGYKIDSKNDVKDLSIAIGNFHKDFAY